jgi:HSP20 family protein
MSLVKRSRSDLDWPDWFVNRRLFDWPVSLRELMEGPEGTLRVEEFEEGGALVVRAEMPGLDPDKDVEITVSDHVLTIRAERRQQSEVQDKRGYRSEFRYGSFVRSMTLPLGAREDDVQASYTDGILEVRVPISTVAPEAKKVPIARG